MRRFALQADDQLYFLHIPKTAGTSLFNVLYEYLPDEERFHLRPHELLNPPESALKKQLIVGHTFYMMHHFLPREPIYLTMLRDPIAQVVSHFRHIKRDTRHPLYDSLRDKTLLDFLRDPELEMLINNFQTFNLVIEDDPRVSAIDWSPERVKYPHLMKQLIALYTRLGDEVLLERAKAHLRNFAFVGVTERFEESVDLLTYTFHWQPYPRSVRMNSDPDPLRDIPAEAREFLAERTQIDRQVYQFACDLFETRRREMIFDLLETDHEYRLPEAAAESPLVAEAIPAESAPYLKENRGWSDGWVGPRWLLSGKLLPPQMRHLEITGTTLLEYLTPPLTLTLLVGGQRVNQIEVSERGNFSLSITLTGAPVEIVADQYFIPAQIGQSPDQRPLSWSIVAMNLTS